MKNLKNKFGLLIATMLVLSACKRDEISSFSAAPAINFVGNTTQYSFMTNPTSEYLQNVDVKIIGNASDHDRTFNAVAVKDANTTAPDSQYEILKGMVKAGSYDGKLTVKLKNSADLSTKTIALKLKLIDSDDFKVGNKESSNYSISWTNQILVPTYWTYYNVYFATRSTAVYRIILKTTGLVSLTAAEYRGIGADGSVVLGTKFGDYIKQWNLDHPNDHLKHDDGIKAGTDIIPNYYTKSKYN